MVVSNKGRRIVITGAFGILGAAVLDLALASGATVAAVDYVTPDSSDDREGLYTFSGIDLGDPSAAAACMTAAAEKMGGIDSLINIAGGFIWENFANSNIDSWDKMFHINVRTTVNASQAALDFLLQSGSASIVNISANNALKSVAGVAAYTASKAAVAKLTESLADEFKAKIRVNAVLPSVIDTPLNRRDMPNADSSAWVTPAELANVILFLTSPNSSAVTGALLPVTGRV
jgi:NAD(P)-dependent dehydrogenase (short-subunit alcohol dehydrogenase family)|tara:strand:+ start:46682 stop:47377 length:696 start_codon:yes stop_codon:yes gene_type:complete